MLPTETLKKIRNKFSQIPGIFSREVLAIFLVQQEEVKLLAKIFGNENSVPAYPSILNYIYSYLEEYEGQIVIVHNHPHRYLPKMSEGDEYHFKKITEKYKILDFGIFNKTLRLYSSSFEKKPIYLGGNI